MKGGHPRPARSPGRVPALRILGIDPGSRYTGYGIIDRAGSKLSAVAYGRIRADTSLDLAGRLHGLCRRLEELLAEHSPGAVAIESLFHGINPKSLIVLAQARGALLATVAAAGLGVEEYAPSEIKSAVTGAGRADKLQVARMVDLVLGLGGEKLPADATDALAVAICFAQRLRYDALTTVPGTGQAQAGKR